MARYTIVYWQPGTAEEAVAFLNEKYEQGLEYVEGMMGGQPIPLPGQEHPHIRDSMVRQQMTLKPLETGLAVLFRSTHVVTIHK